MGWKSPGILAHGVSAADFRSFRPCGGSGFPAPNIPHSAGVRPDNYLMSCESCASSGKTRNSSHVLCNIAF